MKILKNKFILVFLTILVSGCFGDIDNVKGGVMNFNKTLTVGEAFDGWKNCEEKSWHKHKSKIGLRTVQFICHQSNVQNYMNKIKSYLSKEESIKNSKYLEIEINNLIFEFTINKDDSFQLDNVQNEIMWSDTEVTRFPRDHNELLKKVYSNILMLDENEIYNKKVALYILDGLKRLHNFKFKENNGK